MLGDDVVDLADPEAASGAPHPRFDDRVFTASERDAIARSPEPNHLRWTFWAAKESAYKAARKLGSRVVFAPRRFEVRMLAGDQATVGHEGSRWHVRVRRRDDAVHVVALGAPLLRTEPLVGFARVDSTDEDLSAAVRRFAIREIAASLAIDATRLAIARRGRIPVLTVDGEPTADELSLSHHGSVVGFAALLAARGGS
jgi:phosphopantetheinyl transferase (holo-ACP synthase)